MPERRNPEYLGWLRKQPCVACAKGPPSEAAHVRQGTDGGTGLKPSDKHALPLCHNCHTYQHQVGERTFMQEKELRDLRWIAEEYYERFIEEQLAKWKP